MDERVRVKILPLHNIGGVGKAGDVVWMTAAEAEGYVRDGYVEYVEEQRSAVSGEQLAESSDQPVVEDHLIMKPQSKRARKK